MAEKIINVPLKPETKEWLDGVADENGRATGREAAKIIEAAQKRAEKKTK